MPLYRGSRRLILQRRSAAVVTSSGWATLISQSGLVAAWPFDTANTTSSVATETVAAKNAALTNVTLNGSGPPGSPSLNNAGVFNGTTSTALTSFTTGLPSSAFTFACWILFNSIPGGVTFAANDNPGNNGFRFYISTQSQWVLGTGSTTVNYVSVGPNVAPPTWIHYAVTWDGTTLRNYNDGVLDGTTHPMASIANGGSNIGFGYNPSYNGDFMDGKIAGVGLWNRALSGGEVTTLFGT